MKDNIFAKLKQNVGKGIQKVKNIAKHHRKRKPSTDESRPPDVTDTDIAIAKIKSQKRKVNEMIKKVMFLLE